VATSAGAYEGNKMYNIAEESRLQGMDIRPQIAGRPTGVLHGLQSNFHVFVGHPTYAKDVAPLDLEGRVAAMKRPDIRAAILGENSMIRSAIMGLDMTEFLFRIFPLGDNPNYEPDREASVSGMAAAAGITPLEMMYDLLIREDGKELFYQPLGGYNTYNFDFFRKNMQHPNVLFGLSDGGHLRGHRRRRHAHLHPHLLGPGPGQGRALPPGIPGAQADQRHGKSLWPQ